MNSNVQQLANLLELAANEGSIPAKGTLIAAATAIREMEELIDELIDNLEGGGEDTD